MNPQVLIAPWKAKATPDQRGVMFAVALVVIVLCLRYAAHYFWSSFAPLETILVGGGGVLLTIAAMAMLAQQKGTARLGFPLVAAYSLSIVAAIRSLAAW